jgi:hypothetical protein
MIRLNRLTFLVHPFCYAATPPGSPLARFALREQRCAARWEQAARAMPDDHALVIIPVGGHPLKAAQAFVERVAPALGQRCILLTSPYLADSSLWNRLLPTHAAGVAEELRDAYLRGNEDWNKEELYTSIHSRGCVAELAEELAMRGFQFDPAAGGAEAWGESFDGCVTKYSLNLRRLLSLACPVDVEFGLTVPDAAFVLETRHDERLDLPSDLRLFLFEAEGRAIGLYVATRDALAQRPRCVRVPVDPRAVTVLSKRGARLWPPPDEDSLSWPCLGVTEPPQVLVREHQGQLVVPVSTGHVYRLAKSPAYLFASPGVSLAEFRDQLTRAQPT